MKKKICVVTGARSEYSLLKPLLSAIKTSPVFTLQLIASAMHLSPEFGLTVREILDDGFVIDERIEMLLASDTCVGVTKSMGVGLIGFADAYHRLKPDVVVILGDRFEALVAAQAALIANIPIAHIHGGELTLGAFDDSIRHSITKMSHLHFTAHEQYRKRVIQLGEDPATVFAVGPMIGSAIKQYTFLERSVLEDSLAMKLGSPLFLITLLPETLRGQQASDTLGELFSALNDFPEATLVFTKGNADPAGQSMNSLIDDFCQEHAHHAKAFVNLGQHRYLSLMKQASVVIGNSSSGIMEAPLLRIPTVNIGERQSGRMRTASIIDCACEKAAIKIAIKQALSNEHQERTQRMSVQETDPVPAMMEQLKIIDFKTLTQKKFFDWDNQDA